jgi:hypothetical protein
MEASNMDKKQVTYDVPVINMPWLKGRVEDLDKKAVKLGTDPISFTIIRTWTKRTQDAEGHKYNKLMNEITITGIAPKLAGWSFLGTIQHTEAGNILRVINETQIPEQYRIVKQLCGHCNKDRNRKDTYLVTHEDGSFKQLGKSCLKDYTGHVSPAYLAALAQFIDELNKSGDRDYESNRFPLEVPSATFLRMACEAVVDSGAYITNKQAEFTNKHSTSIHAWMSLFPPKGPGIKFTPLIHTEAGETLFNKVQESLKELDLKSVKSDFEHNVLMSWKKEIAEHREVGILGAAIMIHEKALLKKLEFKNNSDSTWIGAVKERSEFEVTITKKFGFETAFGYMAMILMKDESGNILVWKTGTGFEGKGVGDKFRIKATVKKHDTYQDIKQTVLTRCILLQDTMQNIVAN